LRAVDTPTIHVEIDQDDTPPVPVGPGVLAAVAAAAWRAAGFPEAWPLAR